MSREQKKNQFREFDLTLQDEFAVQIIYFYFILSYLKNIPSKKNGIPISFNEIASKMHIIAHKKQSKTLISFFEITTYSFVQPSKLKVNLNFREIQLLYNHIIQ